MTEKDKLLQAKERELAEAQEQLRQQVSCVCCCVYSYVHVHVRICIVCPSCLQVTEKEMLLQAKERELAEAQQQLSQQVSLTESKGQHF